jgi:hypothetical protein
MTAAVAATCFTYISILFFAYPGKRNVIVKIEEETPTIVRVFFNVVK